jgi:hypothetical protein
VNKTLFNPFETNSAAKLLLLGLLFTAIGCALAAHFNARFDGVLDLHFVETLWWKPVLDNIVNISSSVLVLFFAGFYFNKKTRLKDILAISVFCRYPLYLLPLFNIDSIMIKAGENLMSDFNVGTVPDFDVRTVIVLLVFGIFAILMIVWFLINLYNGFQIATNAKGNRAVFVFVAAIILMEIISKIGIALLFP